MMEHLYMRIHRTVGNVQFQVLWKGTMLLQSSTSHRNLPYFAFTDFFVLKSPKFWGAILCIFTMQAYQHLLSLSPVNERHLETIQSAIIAVSLDSDTPKNLSEVPDI